MRSFKEFLNSDSIKKKLKKAGLIAMMALSLASCNLPNKMMKNISDQIEKGSSQTIREISDQIKEGASKYSAADLIGSKYRHLDKDGKEMSDSPDAWEEMQDLKGRNFRQKGLYYKTDSKDDIEKTINYMNNEIFDDLRDIENEIQEAKKELVAKGVDKEYIDWYQDNVDMWMDELIGRLNETKESDISILRKFHDIKDNIQVFSETIKDFKYEVLAKDRKLKV